MERARPGRARDRRDAASPRDLVVEEPVRVGGHTLSILRPRSAEDLLDEEAFERDEFLPYWAELWPSALALAEAVAQLELAGRRVLELGCGLAVPSLVAALRGAAVLATDWSEDAVAFARRNAERNRVVLETRVVSWSDATPLLAAAPWDLVLASDVLYERRNAEQLVELLPRLGPAALVAEPGRPHARILLDALPHEEVAPRVYRLETR